MRRIFWLALVLLLAGCASDEGIVERSEYQVDTRYPALNAWPRVRVLVIHYTAGDFERSLTTLRGRDVSAHYLIARQPEKHHGKPLVYQLVPEEKLAWHAGQSYWRGATRINDTSVGIELENHGWHRTATGRHFEPFDQAQIATLIPLARDIIQRHGITPENVVAHSDVAPQRKDDPGPLFPWRELAQAGIGAWPDADRVTFYLGGRHPTQPVNQTALLNLLARYGYEVGNDMTQAQKRRVIMAFQMHFRPKRYDGHADAETQAIAEALLEKYGMGYSH
jgi:N-acetylmuramoyl-L-alanine amidase